MKRRDILMMTAYFILLQLSHDELRDGYFGLASPPAPLRANEHIRFGEARLIIDDF